MSGPSKKLVLASYRSLVRASNPKLTGIRARESTLDSVFVDQLRKLYQKPVTDGKTAWRNYLMAADAITMMTSSTKHAEAMFDGGWCLNKPQLNQVKNVAGYVGLNMPIAFSEENLSKPASIDSVKGNAATGAQ